MDLQYVGRIYQIGPTVKVTQNFHRRHIVLDCSAHNPHTGITYPNFPVFEAVQSKTDLLDDFEVGEQVIITFDVRGRESQQGTFYNSLRIREISRYPIGGARMDADTNGYD